MKNNFVEFIKDNDSNDLSFETKYRNIKVHKEKYNDRFIILYSKQELNGLRQNDYEIVGYYDIIKNAGYGQYACILGFRKEASSLLHEIKNNSSIPLISKLSDSVKKLDGVTLSMLEKDIQAAHIYESVVADKFGGEFRNEFQRRLVIV